MARMNLSRLLPVLLAVAACSLAAAAQQQQPRKPNVIVIIADDLGYGDVGCYGATKVKTPAIDRLAAQGLRFTDGHASSATCTPSRYSLLTGEYAWRKKGTGILPGDAALIVDPSRPTLPSILKSAGYATGVVGKWHLGLCSGNLDWNKELKPGPREIGFDYSFLIPATVDRVPCVYTENDRVVGLDPADPITVNYKHKVGNEPTGRERPDLLTMKLTHGHDMTIVNGISRIGWMTGGKKALWKDEDIADVITRKAVTFIEQNKDKPFFLYFATHDVHVPRVAHPRFAGKSGSGTRGDVVEQFDWQVGEVAAALDRLNLANDTLIVVTSDNGPVLDDGYADGAEKDLNGHTPAGPLRGGKYSTYEAGTRVPFVVRYPAKVKPGVSDALVCQIDFLASFARLAGAAVPAGAGRDGVDVLPALLGEQRAGRESLIEQGGGVALAVRKSAWKLIPKGGGRRYGGKVNQPELYDLSKDLGEKDDVSARHPEVVRELAALLEGVQDQRP
jgi:arylsulfatase A-like enzyme